MKYVYKYAALMLALLLCLTALWGCGTKLPDQQPEGEETSDQQEQTDGEQQNEQPQLLSDTISCCDGDTTLRFERNAEGTWDWKDDTTFPLDNTYVQELLTTIEQMLTLQPITTDKTPEDLDLDEEEKYVTATDEKGYAMTWYLGKQDENGCYYMCLKGDESGAVYLAPAQLTEQISRSIFDMMILPELPVIPVANAKSVTITTAEKTVTTVPNSSGVWVVGISSVNEKAQPMLQALSTMTLATCVDFRPTSTAPSYCGLGPVKVTVAVEYLSTTGVESSFTMEIGNARSDGYCVRIGEDETIYLMSTQLIDPILAFIR